MIAEMMSSKKVWAILGTIFKGDQLVKEFDLSYEVGVETSYMKEDEHFEVSFASNCNR